jgi:hypothetical protein
MFQEDIGAKAAHGFVIHPGDTELPLGPKVQALPFQAM